MRALLAVNMGGPERPEEIAPYLRRIFADPRILGLPAPLRGLLGAWITRRRLPRVRDRYALIGGSPLPGRTRALCAALRDRLPASHWQRVVPAYRYTQPDLDSAITRLAGEGVTHVDLLPLFPHSTGAMTGSIIDEGRGVCAGLGLALRILPVWGLAPAMIRRQRVQMAAAMTELGPGTRVLFVAHGIPLRDVRRGDDYPSQVVEHASRLAEELPAGTDWSLAWQSRVGPLKWTGPALEDELGRLLAADLPLLLMPLSFVSECLETLYDLDHVAAGRIRDAGLLTWKRLPTYDEDPGFAADLAAFCEEHADD